MILTNVFRFVHMVSMPKMTLECVCMIALKVHLQTITLGYVLLYVQPLPTYLDSL